MRSRRNSESKGINKSCYKNFIQIKIKTKIILYLGQQQNINLNQQKHRNKTNDKQKIVISKMNTSSIYGN